MAYGQLLHYTGGPQYSRDLLKRSWKINIYLTVHFIFTMWHKARETKMNADPEHELKNTKQNNICTSRPPPPKVLKSVKPTSSA